MGNTHSTSHEPERLTMNEDALMLISRQQADYAASLLSDYVKVGGQTDDGWDALHGAVDVAGDVLVFAQDRDVQGFISWVKGEHPYPDHPFDNASVDGFCQQLFELCNATHKEDQ